MSKNQIYNTFFCLCVILFLGSCNTRIYDYEETQYGIKTKNKLSGLKTEVLFYAPDVIRVIKATNDTLSNDTINFSVIQKPGKVDFSITEKNDSVLCLKTSELKVEMYFQSGKIIFMNLQNDTLLFDNLTNISLDKKNYSLKQTFGLSEKEAIYGLGQQQNGKLNQRGEKFLLRQENMKICIPFIQSSKGYGLFWNNYSPTLFEDNAEGMSFESTGTNADYYFMYGKTSDGVITQMRQLTGQAPMFPLWTLGYWQSRERYTSQNELIDVVKKYRKLGVPLDGIVQDWQYWSTDNAYWNAIEWGNPQFPDPKKMIDEVHQLNAHIIISVWPSFGPKTSIYNTFKEKNMLYDFESFPAQDSVKVYDAFNPEARDIYWNIMNKNLFSIGIDGWWLDATEPEHVNVKDTDFDQQTYSGSIRNLYNAFPLVSVGGVYDHQRAETKDKRVFILTRSAFAGQQRYGAISWSGDVDANWQTLQKQIPAALSFSMCGIPYWNSDIGGFFIREHDFKKPLQDKVYHELYVRWLQFATFTPMMRSHGTNAPREIWQFESKEELAPLWHTTDVIKEYIKLRYNLLPYLYSTAWEVSNNSSSFMRPLFSDYNADTKTYNIDNEYIFGKSFLVAPVTEANQKTKKVYLPKGADWYDFWSDMPTKIEGGKEIDCETPINKIPLYIKAGTILPYLGEKKSMTKTCSTQSSYNPPVQYATEKKWDNLNLIIYPGANGEFTLYEDENDNYNYENGKFSTIKMNWNDKEKTLTIGQREGSFDGMLNNRKFIIIFIGNSDKNGVMQNNKIEKKISYTGDEMKIKL